MININMFDAAPNEEDGGNSVESEDELSETDKVDPTGEYTEVEEKSLREQALTIEHKLSHRVKDPFVIRVPGAS